MWLRFVPSESTDSYFEALRGYLEAHGCPVAFYSDKHSVFRINKPEAKGGQGMTQFGRALAELNIEILCANSSQAKGRVERANRTLQDRLVKELRLAGICDIDAGNTFLTSFLARFNQRFAIPPAKPEDVHRPLNIAASRLSDILCHREQRYVGAQLSFHYDRKQIILERSDVSENLGGQSEWGPSENNRRARFYRLTRAGGKLLEAEKRDWEQTAAIIARFFEVKAEDLA